MTNKSRLTHELTESQADFIRTRDPICIIPGCAVASSRCQIDYQPAAIEDRGRRIVDEFAPVCRTHLRLMRQGFKVERSASGTKEWVTPLGRRYPIAPYDHRAWARA